MQSLIKEEETKSEMPSIVRKVYMLLMQNSPMTCSQIADALGIETTETYYLLHSMQDKKLVKALSKMPIRFTAVPYGGSVANKTAQRMFDKCLQYCYTSGNTQVCLNIDEVIGKILDEVSFLQAHVINLEERMDKFENDILQEKICKICGLELNVENACKDTLRTDICNECWIKFNIR